MESKKINRDLLLQALPFGLFIAGMVVLGPSGEIIRAENGGILDIIFFLTVLAGTIGSGLTAGLYITFSDFVMKSLHRLPSSQSVAAFNSVNETVQPLSGRGHTLLIPILILTAVISVILLVISLLHWQEPGSLFLISGSSLYLFSFIITVAYHVPRNNRLLAVFKEQNMHEAQQWWQNEAGGWIFWNSLRGWAALSASVLFILALRSSGI